MENVGLMDYSETQYYWEGHCWLSANTEFAKNFTLRFMNATQAVFRQQPWVYS